MTDMSTLVWKDWPEVLGGLLLLIGFAVALSINSVWLNYAIIIIAGLMAGRVLFKKRGNQPLFPVILIIIIFLVGYLLGSFAFNRVFILIIFLISAYASYKIHKKGYIP